MKIKIFYDYICPYCWIGKGLIDEFKDEFNIQAEWVPFELEPATPAKGRLLTDKFSPNQISDLFNAAQQRGSRYEMVFKPHELVPNSRLALIAGEVAKESGTFENYHENMFHGLFAEQKDIGELDNLLKIASDSGINTEELKSKLANEKYQQILDKALREANKRRITSIPAFVFENGEVFMGALTPEAFHHKLAKIQTKARADRVLI